MYFLRLPKKATVTAVKGRDRKKNLAERERGSRSLNTALRGS